MSQQFFRIYALILESGLAFCTDEDALKIAFVLSAELLRADNKRLYNLIKDRYIYRMSKKAMARAFNKAHPEWCFITCESRIDVWLSVTESTLYGPICDAFDTNGDGFYFIDCAESALTVLSSGR